MTPFQQALGKNYKWWYIFTYFIKTAKAGFLANIVMHITTFLNISAIAFIWCSSTGSNSLLSYVVLGRLYFGLTDNVLNYKICSEIYSGKLNNFLLVPRSYFGYNFVSTLGRRIVLNTNLIIVNLLVILFYHFFISRIDFHFDSRLLLTLVFLPFSYFIRHCWLFITGSLAFFIRESRDNDSFQSSIFTITTYLVGTIIPIDRIPNGAFLTQLPTAYLLHHPMQIYLGKYDIAQIIWTFANAGLWCFGLWILSRILFQKGLKEYEGVGL